MRGAGFAGWAGGGAAGGQAADGLLLLALYVQLPRHLSRRVHEVLRVLRLLQQRTTTTTQLRPGAGQLPEDDLELALLDRQPVSCNLEYKRLRYLQQVLG